MAGEGTKKGALSGQVQPWPDSVQERSCSLSHTQDCPCLSQGAYWLPSYESVIEHPRGLRRGQPSRGQFCGQTPSFSPNSWGMQYQPLKEIRADTRVSDYPESCSGKRMLTLIERLLWAGMWRVSTSMSSFNSENNLWTQHCLPSVGFRSFLRPEK